MALPPIVVIVHGRETLESVRVQLAWGGYATRDFANAQEAIAHIQGGGDDVVLLKSDDAVFDGEPIRAIRAAEATAGVPILALTDSQERQAREHAVSAGASLALNAPVDATHLVSTVALLRRERTLALHLEQTRRELADLRREQRTVLDALIHDLKNSLAVVLANIGWALDYIPANEADIRDALVDAREGSVRIEGMLDELALLRRLESSGPMKRESIRVSELVRRVVDDRSSEAQSRDITVVADVDDSLEFRGDGAVLRRLLDGLLESSIKSAPRMGTVSLSAHNESGLEISVRSIMPRQEGGMADGRVSAPASKVNGALRLYFCKKAAEAFHGELQVTESDESTRSLVVRLPAVGTS